MLRAIIILNSAIDCRAVTKWRSPQLTRPTHVRWLLSMLYKRRKSQENQFSAAVRMLLLILYRCIYDFASYSSLGLVPAASEAHPIFCLAQWQDIEQFFLSTSCDSNAFSYFVFQYVCPKASTQVNKAPVMNERDQFSSVSVKKTTAE